MPRSRSTAKQYGSETQRLVEAWYRTFVWPHATAAGAGSPGRDLLNVPASIEIKGRADFDPLNWVRQAIRRIRPTEDEFPPWAVMRCIGQGERTVGQFIVLQSLADHTAMVLELIELREYKRTACCGIGCTGDDCSFCERDDGSQEAQ